jgi:polyhydroxyalkanoate synthesis repressor PhaR
METKPEGSAPPAAPSERPRRVIKRYSNRKLYDTKDSRYVTLLQIAEMVRTGEDVQIIDNNTKDDLTEVTLAQIIYEEQKAHSRNVPLQTLKELIHSRTEKVLGELRESPLGRLIPGTVKPGSDAPPGSSPTLDVKVPTDPAKTSSLVEQAKHTLEDWQHQIDDRVKAVLPSFMPWQQLQHEVKRLSQRIEELEAKLKSATHSSGNAGAAATPSASTSQGQGQGPNANAGHAPRNKPE